MLEQSPVLQGRSVRRASCLHTASRNLQHERRVKTEVLFAFEVPCEFLLSSISSTRNVPLA